MTIQRLGFFTRVLDDAPPPERYRLGVEQIERAEQLGFDSVWIAQHHFDGAEGGMPAPLVFLSHVAALTHRIRLSTGIITLPLDSPVRVAEDASVLDALSGGRVELGVGSGGTASSFGAFGLDSDERSTVFQQNLEVLREALRGDGIRSSGSTLYPSARGLADRIWQATFSVAGGARAGAAGDGLMLSRTQPRPDGAGSLSLADIQDPIVDAYLDALPPGTEPRIMASRSVFVADDQREALALADRGLRRAARTLSSFGPIDPDAPLDQLLASFDSHVGDPEHVTASLAADRTLARATDLSVQVHSIDPPHAAILRSIELIATRVAPALGWRARASVTTAAAGSETA